MLLYKLVKTNQEGYCKRSTQSPASACDTQNQQHVSYFNEFSETFVLPQGLLQALVALGVAGAVHGVDAQEVHLEEGVAELQRGAACHLKGLLQVPASEDTGNMKQAAQPSWCLPARQITERSPLETQRIYNLMTALGKVSTQNEKF